MADKIISSLKFNNTDYQIKDREAADTRITEAEIEALIQSYSTDHKDHTPQGGNN